MAIITAANFDYKGPLANFERDSYATLSDMVNVNDNYLPNVFIGVCLETGKAYLYNKSNTVDPTLGKWRELVGGTDITDYIRKTEDFSTFEPMYYGEIAQYIGQTNQNYTHGYFYKAIPHFAYSNIQFTPSGDYEIEVSISDEDLTTFFNEEFIPTDSPFVSGQFGYRQTNPEVLWSFSPETETHEFRSHLGTPEQYAESGFTVTPPIGPSQGLTFTVDHSTTYTYEQVDVQPATDLVWGNIEGDITNQTDLNTELTSLQDQIDTLKSRGRYLSLWNCVDGLAMSLPPEDPYTYRTGDYFIVGEVADAEGETNKRPTGLTYSPSTPSTVVETEEVAVDDTYIFDGSVWHLQKNTQKTLTFANIVGDPYENTELATALDEKADVSSIGDATLTITKSGVAVGSFSANATEDVTLDVDTDILPTQTGNEGKFLKTDGSHASWQEVKPIVWVSYVDE